MDNSHPNQVQSHSSEGNDNIKYCGRLDQTYLTRTYEVNPAFGVKMFQTFLRTIGPDLEILDKSAESRDFSSVKAMAHKIKNNFIWVGLPDLSDLTYRIEKHAGEQSEASLPLVKVLLKENEDVLPQIIEQLKELQAVAV